MKSGLKDTSVAAQMVLMAAILVLSLAAFALGQQAPAAQNAPGNQEGPRGGGGRGAGQAGGRGAAAPAVPARPVPRWPDGTVRLGVLAGETGLWFGGGGGAATVPYQPWAEAMVAYRRQNEMEPHTRCKPSGGPRQFLTPYGVEILDVPELKRIFIMDVGGPHTFRIIYTDGREHPKDLIPSYYGHSVGRWEKDTLIVDTIGFNERFWMDRGQAPHTEKLHLIEKFTRTDMNTMTYEMTVEDPGAYTAIWSRGPSTMNLRAGSELFEFICQDNNFAPELLVGTHEFVDRTSTIIP